MLLHGSKQGMVMTLLQPLHQVVWLSSALPALSQVSTSLTLGKMTNGGE